MCAILGIKGNLPDIKIIEKARDTMIHRGPDDSGVYYNKKDEIALGHRRLSIIDLSDSGKQPLESADGRYIIIFNGEIYNYIELKKELVNFYNFKTRTDTEVLLVAYIKWGSKCLDKLNGMFSFAIWDKKEKKLFCARDRLGIKPFFYTTHNNSFYFASEIKGLLALGIPVKENESVIYDYLRFGLYGHTNNTFFKDIKVLPAGHTLKLKNKKVILNKYWSLDNLENKYANLSIEEASEKFIDLLKNAIRLRLRSDVPIGINLSSGLDSNGLLYFGQKITGLAIPIFSMCVESDEYNECEILEKTLTETQKRAWSTTLSKPNDIAEGSKKMNLIQDQPYGGVPTIVYEKLNKKAKEENVTVLLEGQGLDELLAGYKYYFLEDEKDNSTADDKKINTLTMSQDTTNLEQEGILSDNFIKRNKTIDFPRPFKSSLLNAQYRDLMFTKLPRVLRFNDHVSMAYGRELRLPYLDHNIVEFCFGLPAKYKLRDGVQKLLIRESMKEYIPNIVNIKAKKTFGAVQTEWMRTGLKEFVYSILESTSFKNRPYWNHNALNEKIEKFYKDEGNNSFFIWQCINLEIWLKEYID